MSGPLGATEAPVTESRSDAVPLHGLIAIDKPSGLTSHDVVERVRRRLGSPGAGNIGTLDPAATGLLIVALGAATRCAAVWQGGEKTYDGRLRLGVVTDSQDTTGRVLEQRPVEVSEEALREGALALIGEIDQVPPMVAAVRVKGERLYRMARRGEVVERAPRRVRVMSWTWDKVEIPEASFRVRCSGGTYVRTLAHDLGQRLGCGAALAGLRRVRSEPFGLERAITWRELMDLPASESWERAGIPLDRALAPLPHVAVDAAQADAIGHGRALERAASDGALAPIGAGPRSIVIEGSDGTPLALGELSHATPNGDTLLLRPHVVFPWAVREGRA